MFQVAVKALPYKSTFISLLNPNEGETDRKSFEVNLMTDMEGFCDAAKVVIGILDGFLKSKGLDVEEQI